MVVLSVLLQPAVANAAAAAADARSLLDFSLEELSRVRVFSASRHLESTQGAPSAIFVLTRDDLLRSGVTTVPDALRLVPGVQVGRVDANKWAVSIRGFNSREANKLLVLVDGRSIYDPLFSGMLWESQDFLLEDIERIEVIRGPGGTLWGANAFNGVINIITRHADETNGTFGMLAVGDEERYIAALRHGWQIGEDQDARVYVKGRERDAGFSPEFEPADSLRDVRGGFRWDWAPGETDALRISGDVFDASAGIRENAALAHRVEHSGHNLLARWSRRHAAGNDLRLQLYYDVVDYESIGFTQDRDTWDLEFQQSLNPASRHRVVWGLAYRRVRDHTLSALAGFVDILPASRDDATQAVFLQDTFSLLPDRLDLVLGIKYEETDYADAAWLPNVRLAWTPTEDQTWWAAVSEATRVPSRLEADLTFFGSLRIGDDVEAEKVRAFEAGHRQLLSSELWYDIALFYNDYNNLAASQADGTLRNFMQGYTRGAELAVRWEPLPRFRADVSYTLLSMDLELEPGSTADPGLPARHEGLAPRHQLTARAMLELNEALEIDATARYVDELTAIAVPDYTQLDLALNWRPLDDWEFSFIGTNLLDSHQLEQDFAFSGGLPSQVERSLYFRVSWRR
ncbi:MAG TPA: TonB-dependent receptor [Woeseiaceae bacterium]|nr:TonB-dependent receptor [Woeseiaceae bacterium]